MDGAMVVSSFRFHGGIGRREVGPGQDAPERGSGPGWAPVFIPALRTPRVDAPHRSAHRPGVRNPMSLANRCATLVAAGCGAACAAFGMLVVAGWHSGAMRLASAF